MKKNAAKDQHGLFQHFQSEVANYNTRDSYISNRGGKPVDQSKLYGVGPEHEDAYKPESDKPSSLSTRYVPGRPGVQAQRLSTGVFQDPNTREVFDYNEGFITSDGRVFNGGSVDLQTDLVTLANNLDSSGFYKEASFIDSVLLKMSQDMYNPCERLAVTLLTGSPYTNPTDEDLKVTLTSMLSTKCGDNVCREINEYIENNISDKNFAENLDKPMDITPENIEVDTYSKLASIANRLDKAGLTKEASVIDSILLKISQSLTDSCKDLASTILMGIPYADPYSPEGSVHVDAIASILKGSCGDEACSDIAEFLRNNAMDYEENLLDDPEAAKHDEERSRDILNAALSLSNK